MPKLPMGIEEQVLMKMLGQAPVNKVHSREMVPANNKSGAVEKLYPDYAANAQDMGGSFGPKIPVPLLEKAEAEFQMRFGHEPASDSDYAEVQTILREMGYDDSSRRSNAPNQEYDSPVDEQINQTMDDSAMMQQLLEQAMGNTDAVVDARSGEPVTDDVIDNTQNDKWVQLFNSLPPCETEDSDNCRWDASAQGNGKGNSFVAIDGKVYYKGDQIEE